MGTRLPGPYTSAQRKFGDIMCIFLRDPEMKRAILQHTLLCVDQDVVFEKAGTGDLNPFRLTDVATVETVWKPTAQGGLYDWELSRPRLETDEIQTGAKRFSLRAHRPDKRWPQFWQWSRALQDE